MYVYGQCQSAELSVTPLSVMMASYILLYVVCVVVCAVHCGHISGTIEHNNGEVSEVTVPYKIFGNNWGNTRVIILDTLEDAETVPKLTMENFKSIERLYLRNISLERVPVFVNTSIGQMVITANKLERVPANAFSVPRPWFVDLSNNEIQSMAEYSVNLEVQYVHLNCNKLSNFSESWFEAPASVKTLNLRSNRIESIPDRAFNQMTGLRDLALSYNRITSVGSEAFSTGIVKLELQFNDITQLTADMFARRAERMNKLYVYHNQLNYLPEALLVKLEPRHIALFGNPWQCQCLRDIERWLRVLNSTLWYTPSRRGEPVCVAPVNFQNVNVCVPVVDKDLQQTYANGLSPVQECWTNGCHCTADDTFLARIIHKIVYVAYTAYMSED